MSEKLTFGRKIAKLRKDSGYSQDSLAHAMDIKRSVIAQVEGDRQNPTLEFLRRFVRLTNSKYEDILEGWEKDQDNAYQYGEYLDNKTSEDDYEGEKYYGQYYGQDYGQYLGKSQTKSTQKKQPVTGENIPEYAKRNVHKKDTSLVHPKAEIIEVPVNETGNPTIVQLDIQAAAGLPYHVDDPEYLKDKPAFSLPGEQYQQGEYFSIQVNGDSMEDTIYHGDWLICERVYDLMEVKDNYVHVVVTKEGVVTKRVLNRIEKRGSLALKSDNEAYTTYDEPAGNILMVLRATGRFTAIMKNRNAGMARELSDLKDRVEQIEKRLPKGD